VDNATLLARFERHFDSIASTFGEFDDRPRMLLSAMQRLARGERAALQSVRELWASLFGCKLDGPEPWRTLVAAVTNLASDVLMTPCAGANSVQLALVSARIANGEPRDAALCFAKGEVARAVLQ